MNQNFLERSVSNFPDWYIRAICQSVGLIIVCEIVQYIVLNSDLPASRSLLRLLCFSLLPHIYSIPALIFFWKEIKIGWPMLAVNFLINIEISASESMHDLMNRHFELLLPNPVSNFWQLLFYVTVLIIIMQKSIREIYGVEKKTIVISVLMALIATLAFLFVV